MRCEESSSGLNVEDSSPIDDDTGLNRCSFLELLYLASDIFRQLSFINLVRKKFITVPFPFIDSSKNKAYTIVLASLVVKHLGQNRKRY